ncbi:MarR family winged helix-turn-helix transcriptional regulator [Caldanaerobius polysaccharolyticus]|uniref:MarR family winged helix-turn-helix transcriptional regulator n=1 Tax=Caldanaerobius polysaccharolyticus TaxID=44256 RepID=UPI00047C9E38|nr:MarR family transcriptional regulator [Caldanaerobius polysaccharolyticus]
MEEIKNGFKVLKMLKQILDIIKQEMKYQSQNIDITGPQSILMGVLAHYGEMKISDLSEKLGLSNSTVSGIINRLEKQGLVKRTRSAKDRRVIYVNVTPEFKRSFQKYFDEAEKRIEEIINSATPEELNTILDGLNTLKKVLDREKR